MTRDEIIKYWVEISDKDFNAIEHLFKNNHYHLTLFVGHLVIEKLLKAFYVKNIDEEVPHIHNLLRVAELANLELSDEQKIFLNLVTTFNIQARYPDLKYSFYKKCTREFTEIQLNKIKEFRQWIKKILNE